MTYLYDDDQHPERITGTVESPEWTDDDRAALLALDRYEQTLCPGCGIQKRIAWATDGWTETKPFRCDPCTVRAKHGADDPDKVADVTYVAVWMDPEQDYSDFPPLRYADAPDDD